MLHLFQAPREISVQPRNYLALIVFARGDQRVGLWEGKPWLTVGAWYLQEELEAGEGDILARSDLTNGPAFDLTKLLAPGP